MFEQADAIIAALALGFDHADDIAAALVLCLAAVYSVRAIWVWRGTRKLRREIEYLDSQGRQIFKLIANEDKNPVPTPK
jgi:hypothetical protein